MLSFETERKSVSLSLSLPAMASGDWSSYSFFSTNARSSILAAIFFPWYFALCRRTYVLCCAFWGLYFPFTLFLLISDDIVHTDLSRASAIFLNEYFFLLKIAISLRSLLVRCVNFFLFFHTFILTFFDIMTLCQKYM